MADTDTLTQRILSDTDTLTQAGRGTKRPTSRRKDQGSRAHKKLRLGGQLAAAKEDGVKQPQSKLIIDFRYQNELPQPSVPKLLRSLPESEKFSRYRPTQLELDHRPFLLGEDDIATRVDLLNPWAYGGPMQEDPDRKVTPADEPLLLDDDISQQQRNSNEKKMKMYDPTMEKREAIILRRHILIQNDLYNDAMVFITGHEASEKKLHREAMETSEVDEIADKVEQTFNSAQRPPVHPTKPDMKPKRILPVLPDFELWASTMQQVSFDEPPEVCEREDLLFKTVPNPRTTCFGYFSKKLDGAEGQYRLVRNYVWENKGQYTKYLNIQSEQLLLSEVDGKVLFVPIPAKMQLSKQKAKRLDIEPDLQQLNVSYREPNPREVEEEQQRQLSLFRADAQASTDKQSSLEFADSMDSTARGSASRALPIADGPEPLSSEQEQARAATIAEETLDLFGPGADDD